MRDLIERTALVREMTSTPGWDLLKDRAAHDIAARQQRVLGGNVADLAEYKKLAGWIDAAEWVLTLPDRMEAELEAARVEMAEGGGAA